MWNFVIPALTQKRIQELSKEISDLKEIKNNLALDREKLCEELSTERKRARMAIEEEQHKHRLEMAEKNSIFSREKAEWQQDKERFLNEQKKEREAFERDVAKEAAFKLTEATGLLKLDHEQRIAKIRLDADAKLQEVKVKLLADTASVRTQLQDEHYEKLSEAMVKLHAEGNQATQFIQEIALKMLDKGETVQTARMQLTVPGAKKP